MISIRKRGRVYQYCFEVGKVNGKRKQITKSGFKTKNEAFAAGQKAYDKFINGESTTECNMLYSYYLDYWMKEYFEINYKYSTAKRYKESFDKIKEDGIWVQQKQLVVVEKFIFVIPCIQCYV